MMTLMQIGLDDKYRLDAKRIYLSGIQALVRLPMLQRERDRLQNLNTGGFMPVLNPATLQDYLDLGLYGFALSRFSGCWVGFKAISETVESSASIYSDPSRVQVVLPTDFEMPPGGLNIRWPDPPLEQEWRLHGPKMAAVAAFARANQLDRVVLDGKPARFGIAATGKAYLDLRQALADLGIAERDAHGLGLRIYKVALTWPLEESGAERVAECPQGGLVVDAERRAI